MAASELSEHLISAGEKLLTALDAAEMRPQGAGWIFDHAIGDWRFVVFTSLVTTMGRTRVYKALISILDNLDMPDELTIADIHLDSTNSAMFKTIGSMFRIEGKSVIRFVDCRLGTTKFDAAIYRWSPAPPEKMAKQIEREFKRKVKELTG
jgi:hypothetical protein